MGEKWIDLKKFGILYREIDLVIFDVPLLFVCKNESQERKLVLCLDEELGEYIVANVNNSLLLDMLRNKITMEQVFRKSMNGKLIHINYNFDECSFESFEENVSEVNAENLPDVGTYFELCNDKIELYEQLLENDLANKRFYGSICFSNTYFTKSFEGKKIQESFTENLYPKIPILHY